MSEGTANNPYASPAAPARSDITPPEPEVDLFAAWRGFTWDMPDAVAVSGKLEIEDITAANSALTAKQSSGTRQSLASTIANLVVVLLLCLVIVASGVDLRGAGGMFVGLLTFLLACVAFVKWAQFRRKRRDVELLAPKLTWSFRPDGTLCVSDRVAMFCRWSKYCQLMTTRDQLLLCHSPQAAEVIPRRWFQSDGHWLATIELVRSRLGNQENAAEVGPTTITPVTDSIELSPVAHRANVQPMAETISVARADALRVEGVVQCTEFKLVRRVVFRKWWRAFSIVVTWLVAIVALSSLVEFTAVESARRGAVLGAILAVVILGLLVGCTAFGRWRQWGNTDGAQALYVVAPEGIICATKKFLRQTLWHQFVGQRLVHDIVLLQDKSDVCTVIPRRWFSKEADWNQFTNLVRRRVPQI